VKEGGREGGREGGEEGGLRTFSRSQSPAIWSPNVFSRSARRTCWKEMPATYGCRSVYAVGNMCEYVRCWQTSIEG
jgi:hypothetical protein